MKYFIGYVIEGEAAEYHQELVKRVAAEFNVQATLNHKAPSHITIKHLSNREGISDVERVLAELCTGTNTSDFTLGGIGSFGRDVIYMGVNPSLQMVDFRNDLFSRLKNLQYIPWYAWDNGKVPNFHATVCEEDIGERFEDIKRYLAEYKRRFRLKFDHVDILKKPDGEWVPHRRFTLQ